MTEDDAKTRWCPFARYASVRGNGINRWVNEEVQLNPEPARCIGSACMAWRWDHAMNPDFGETKVNGYCGLAGKP